MRRRQSAVVGWLQRLPFGERVCRPQPRHVVGLVILCGATLMLLFLWITTNLQIMHSLWFPPQLVITEHTIPIRGLPPDLAFTKLAVLSDVHFSSQHTHISLDFLQQIVSTVNGLEPTLVLIVGDVVNNDPSSASVIGDILAQMKPQICPGGALVVLGNHDDRQIVQALKDKGLDVMRNEVRYPLGQGLAFVGMGDVGLGDFSPETVMSSLPASLPRIVLSHHPDTAHRLKKWRVDLQVAGHTHATQIKLPVVGALLPWLHSIRWLLPKVVLNRLPLGVMEDWNLVYGMHSLAREGHDQHSADEDPSNRVLITAGVGTTPPFRLAIPSEVMLLTLVPASPSIRQE